MRVLHVTFALGGGGAGIAARRIIEAERHHADLAVEVIATNTGDSLSGEPSRLVASTFRSTLNARIEHAALHVQLSTNPVHRTLALVPSGIADQVLRHEPDVVHLHWVGGGTISIKEIGRVAAQVPTVWTLHDSWAFCGADHHPHYVGDERHIRGYTRSTRLQGDSRLDVDAWVYRLKQRTWKTPISLVAPSRFMADRARASLLAREWPVSVIPHPLDKTFGVEGGNGSRSSLALRAGLDPERPIVAFASSAGSDFSKGLDLLADAIGRVKCMDSRVQFVALGDMWPGLQGIVDFSPGHQSESEVYEWLTVVDTVLVTSRIESFSLVAQEAQAAGTPVVAFSSSGLLDVVDDGQTGFLVNAWDTGRLASATLHAIRDTDSLGSQAAIRARRLWSPHRVASMYLDTYTSAIAQHGSAG